MRLLLLLAVAALLASEAAAQATLRDPAGDVAVRAAAGAPPAPDSTGQFSGADLLGLTAEEVRDGVWVNVTTGPPAPSTQAMFTRIRVNASFDGLPYQLYFDQSAQGNVAYWTDLGTYHIGVTLPVAVQGGTRSALVPRDSLLDANGAAGLPGKALTVTDAAVVDTSATYTPQGAVAAAEDDMPGPATLTLALGDPASHGVHLRSPAPMRNSNGEETVYNYALVLENLLHTPQTIALEAVQVPAGWSVHLPVDTVLLDADGVQSVPVLLAVPFKHQHGAVETFTVQAHRVGEADILSQARLGVRFLAVPQPAGHHDTVWLHSLAPKAGGNPGDPGLAYFNALADDPADQKAAVQPMCIPDGAARHLLWSLRLLPDLQIGLTFDHARPFALDVPLQPQVDTTGAHISARLVVDGEPVAASAEAAVPPLPAGQATVVRVELPLDPRIATIPPSPAGYMELDLEATDSVPGLQPTACGLTAPVLAPGGVMAMPLVEYHDPLPILASGSMDAQAAPPRVAPGSHLVLQHRLAAPRAQGVEARLRVFGAGADHATLDAATVSLGPDAARNFTLAVDVPKDAEPGRNYDIVVEATDGKFIAMHRTSFVVDPAAAAVDAPGPVTPTRHAPALPFGLAALAGLALALLRRDRALPPG